jgi:hypothetical protein
MEIDPSPLRIEPDFSVASPAGAEDEAAEGRGLSPLLWSHVNPYGEFHLDLDERLPLAA